MTATAKSPKLSQTMGQCLADLGRGRGFYRSAPQTIKALINRKMICWDQRTCTHILTVAGWAFLKDAYQIERPADAGRLTVEEALELTYSETPTAAERAEDLATGMNGLAYPSFGEAAGAAMEHNAWMATRIVESRAAEVALDQAEADAKSRLDAVVKQQARDDRPKSAMTELAAEDFQPGYRYWAVRPGFEAAWTIASVEVRTARKSRQSWWSSPAGTVLSGPWRRARW